jgi:hypothetical protein
VASAVAPVPAESDPDTSKRLATVKAQEKRQREQIAKERTDARAELDQVDELVKETQKLLKKMEEELGCEIVKLFPAAAMDGPAFIRGLHGPSPASRVNRGLARAAMISPCRRDGTSP